MAEGLLTIRNQNGSYLASSIVDDYRFRPLAYEHVNLYEWVQCAEKKARLHKELREFEEQLQLNSELVNDPQHSEDKNSASNRDIQPDYDGESDREDFIDDDSSSQDSVSDNLESSDDGSDWNSEYEDAVIVEKEANKDKGRRINRLPFLPEHKAAFETHSVHCDF
jgi:hypothetical protein